MRIGSLLNVAAFIILIFVVGYRFYDYVIADNITLNVYAPCDVESQNCFVISNENAATYEFQTAPYKKIEIVDRYAPACLEEHSCASFSCKGLTTCKEITCTEATAEGDETCMSDSDQ